MIFKKIEKIHSGKFVSRYNLTYETTDYKEKVYEMISRRPDLKTYDDLRSTSCQAVVIIVTDEDNSHILLNKEFRMATGHWIYNFPAGLIDNGETALEAAKRELQEETGLILYEISDTLPISYSAASFSNETNICILGKARGTFQKSSSTTEEIEANWYSKEQVRELLKTELFAARTQAYCYVWSEKKPSEN